VDAVALGLLGTLDLSVVTDRLVTLLHDDYEAWPLWDSNGGPLTKFHTTINGAMPESVRTKAGCQLNLYLLHIRQNAAQHNAPVLGRVTPIPYQPLALELYYLLTAFSSEDYRQEQRAMSVAVRCLYEHPIVRMTVPIDGTAVPAEFTLQMQVETPDDLGRIWQAFNTAYRLSAMYRASVVFVTPKGVADQPAPPPDRVVVTAEPATIPFAPPGQVVGTRSATTAFAPSSTPADPELRRHERSPAVVGPGERFEVLGAGLDQLTAARSYLLPPSGPEQEITGWADPDPTLSTPARRTLRLPAGAAAPPAGVYQVRVGSDTATGDTATYRSTATPFSVTARVGPATNPPVLVPVAGVLPLPGAGFVAGSTELLLDTVRLAEVPSGTPGPGQFRVGGPDTVTFRPPAGLPPGRYGVRVRVNGVEAIPAWWVDVP
jgi:hypothetical protein